MAANKNILFVLTSHDKFLSGKPTGWYLPEAAHPYYVFKNAGYTITFASPKGGKAPLDPSSVEMFKEDEEATKFLNDPEAKQLYENTKKLVDVKADDYASVLYVDLTTNQDSIALIHSFLSANKPIAALCHAPTVLLNCQDPKTGEALVKGKKVTCFSDEEEKQAGLVDEIPFLVETRLRALGADFQNSRQPWGEEVCEDGLVITGANPASAGAMAKKLLARLGN
ncbi:Glutathione-independent glyoxalase HSP31 [Rhodotorula toruloides]|nr:Glutathione-independent glyoxalase HSP31 [Rhodotorula toruloides]